MATHVARPLRALGTPLDRVREALRLRAARPDARARLAAAYEHLVVEPSAHARPLITAKVPVQRLAVREAELELLAIAVRLRTDPAPPAEGVRSARRLVTDGTGPVYAPAERDRLTIAARDVLAELESGH